MSDIITLKNEDITRELFDRAQFIFFASGGAMGDPGEIEIVTDDGTTYGCNYVYGDADIDLILEACPPMKLLPEGVPEGWEYHYLGYGNHLLFRVEYNDKYSELLGDKGDEVGGEYQSWHDIAVSLCGK